MAGLARAPPFAPTPMETPRPGFGCKWVAADADEAFPIDEPDGNHRRERLAAA